MKNPAPVFDRRRTQALRLERRPYFAEACLLLPPVASSSSIISSNFGVGCAPVSGRPSIKNAGVPSTPTFSPAAWSALIWLSYFVLAKQASKAVVFIPRFFAVALRSAGASLL